MARITLRLIPNFDVSPENLDTETYQVRRTARTKEDYIKEVFYLYENRKELENFDKQARIQAEQYGSNHYASRVLDVYNRAIKEKKDENRFGLISRVVKAVKGVKNDSSIK